MKINKTSRAILNDWQIRKGFKRKTKFINYIVSEYQGDNKVTIDQSKGLIFNNRNILIGDVAKAKTIITAHYDTCAQLPFPNFITPYNMILTILYGFAVVFIPIIIIGLVPIFIPAFRGYVGLLTDVFIFGLIIQMMFGYSNRHNANDNTSGVIVITEMLESMTKEEKDDVLFVLFDNEEVGLVGSSRFYKKYKDIVKDKPLINLDCVGDGDNILFSFPKKATNDRNHPFFVESLTSDYKNIMIEKNSKIYYPSDQIRFPKGIAVASFKKSKIFGYYCDKIHTSKDTYIDEVNILEISRILKNYLTKVK